MDPLLRDQIESLRKSPNPGSQAQATILEVLVEVREQTFKTNGRVTKLESSCVGHEDRLVQLEGPAKRFAILWGGAISLGSGIVVVLGLFFGFLSTDLGDAWLHALNNPDTAAEVGTAASRDIKKSN
jgi:hypothetical protein